MYNLYYFVYTLIFWKTMLRRLLLMMTLVWVAVTHTAFAQDVDWSAEEELLYKDQLEEAVKQLKPKVAANPDDPYGYYLLGTAQFDLGDYENARITFQTGAEKKNRYALNQVGMARIYILQKKETEAKEAIERALYLDKGKDVNVKFAVAKAYLDWGKLKDAEVQLRSAQLEAPNNPRSYVMLGDFEYARGVKEFALQQYQKAIEIDPTYIPAYTRIGELKIQEAEELIGDDDETAKKRLTLYNEGLELLNTAIQKKPDFAPSYRVRGDLMLKAGKYEQGRKDYESYLGLQKNDLNAELNYGKFLFLGERYREAIEQYNKIDTVTGVKLRLLGMSYEKLGQLDKAKASMDQYFTMKTEEYRISDDYEVYGRIMLSSGDIAKADENFDKAIAMKSDRRIIYQKLAEEFKFKATNLAKEKLALDKDRKAALVEANNAFTEYNAIRTSDPEKAKELYAKGEAKKAEADEIGKQMDQLNATDIKSIYKKEAHYRQKALEKADPVALSHYYALGTALYNAGEYEPADKQFEEVLKLAPTYAPGHIYRLRCAQRRQAADTTVNYMLEPAQKTWDAFGAKENGSLSNAEKQALGSAAGILGSHHVVELKEFAKAIPFLEKAVALTPGNKDLQSLLDYCKQNGAAGGK